MNKRHYEHTLPNIRGSLSNTYPVTYGRFLWIFRLAGASTGIFIMENRQTDIPSRLFPSCPDVAQ